MDDSDAIASYYAGDAATYAQLWAPALLPASQSVVARLPLADAARVLDLGGGVGALTPTLRAAAPHALVVEADRTAEMVRLAPGPRCQVDARWLPFATGSFDAAVLAFMLFHVPSPPQALSEVRRVLRPGGTIGALVWGTPGEASALPAFVEELDRAGAQAIEALPAQHAAMDTLDKLTALVAGSGFEQVSAWQVPWRFAPDLEGFLAYRSVRGITGRRMATLSDEDRSVVVDRVRERLEGLPAQALHDTSEVLAVTAVAR